MISRQALREYLERPHDSFAWMKALKKDELFDEFKRYRVRPRFKTDPWTHQAVCFHIGMCMPHFLFLLDMGTGKTKILLDIMTQLLRERKMRRALVAVPRLLNLGSWERAAGEHSDIETTLAMGTIEEKWDSLMSSAGALTVVDYPGLYLALTKKAKKGKREVLVLDAGKVEKLRDRYNFFAADESHKAKNVDTLRFGMLRAVTETMDYRYASTGTLFGRNVEDIWSQFYLVDRGETFGDTLGMFREAFFDQKYNQWKTSGVEYEFDRKKTRLLHRFLQHRSIRYEDHECNDLPACMPVPVYLRMPDEQREHYMRAVNGLIEAGGRLAEVDNAYHRMRQAVAGFLQWGDDLGKHVVRFGSNPKLDAVLRLVEESGDSKIVVSHEYTESGRMITEALAEAGYGYEWVWGGCKDPIGAVRRFVDDPEKRVFVMNSESGGTGTDELQSVARYLAFYESPTSPITRQQVLKRIHRAGQKKRTFVYDLIMRNTIDARILGFIAEGRDLHEAVVGGSAATRRNLLF